MEFFIDQYIIGYIPWQLDDAGKANVKHYAAEVLQWADWFCGAHDPRLLAKGHLSVVVLETVFALLCALTLLHAFKRGGRTVYLWISILAFAITIESLRVAVPDLNHRWYAQTLFVFGGRRIPQFVIFGKYQTILYTAYMTVERMYLPWYSEAAFAGLLATVMAFPFELLGVKMLWWVWHDNDALLFDRAWNVPVVEYQLYLASAGALWLTLKALRQLLLAREYEWRFFMSEWFVAVVSGCLAPFFAFALVAPLNTELHDRFEVSAQTSAVLMFSVALLLFWLGERNPCALGRLDCPAVDIVYLAIFVLYHAFFMFLISLSFPGSPLDPAFTQATGFWQPIGPCDRTQTITNALLQKSTRASYLCLTRYSEPFNFDCLPERRPPQMRDGNPILWYEICGTRFEPYNEYQTMVLSSSALCLIVVFVVHLTAGDYPVVPIAKRSPRQAKGKPKRD